MKKKQLKKLRRIELLEILLEQSKELEKTKQELEETKRKLEEKTIKIQNAGSLADAVLSLNNIFEIAQKSADEYLENIKKMEKPNNNEEIPMAISEKLENVKIQEKINNNVNLFSKKSSLDEMMEISELVRAQSIKDPNHSIRNYWDYDVKTNENDDFDI